MEHLNTSVAPHPEGALHALSRSSLQCSSAKIMLLNVFIVVKVDLG